MQTSYEDKQDIQLMRFADYFARAFSSVSASQFPWTKSIKESSVAKISDVSFISSSFEIEYYIRQLHVIIEIEYYISYIWVNV